MKATDKALISIFTPVYNGEEFLKECIESVLGQTYQNWRYVIVNNRSTDNSLAIAQHYARMDARVTVIDGDTFLPVLGSMNRAISSIEPDAAYCKPLMADDRLYPDCLERMVEAALEHPTVGLVCAYGTNGKDLIFDGIPPTGGGVSFLTGRAACRTSLLSDAYFFGSPTTMLVRADLVRKRSPFYNPANMHADEESCYDILQESDFCFVHQILALCREHGHSQTSRVRGLGSLLVGHVYSLMKYGPAYLPSDEFEERRRQRFEEYYGFLASRALRLAPREFWEYHRAKFATLGTSLDRIRLTKAIARSAMRRLLSHLTTRGSARRAA